MCASLFIQRDEFFIFLFRHFCHAHAHEHSVYKCTSVLLTVVVRKFKLLNFLFEHFWGNQMQLNRINALDIIKINKFSVLFCLFFLRIPHTAFSQFILFHFNDELNMPGFFVIEIIILLATAAIFMLNLKTGKIILRIFYSTADNLV